MFRSSKPASFAAALLAAIAFFQPSPASALFKMYLQEDGGAITEVATTGTDFSGLQIGFPVASIFGDFSISSATATSVNSTVSNLLSNSLSVTNTAGSTHTLVVYAVQTNYTLPVGTKLNVESGLGGTLNAGTVGLSPIFQAFASSTNANGALAANDYTNGPQSAALNVTTFDTGSASGVFTRSGNYSLTSKVTLQLGGGSQVQFTDHINVTATPAPAGVMLALAGLPVMSAGAWLRRRKSKAQAV